MDNAYLKIEEANMVEADGLEDIRFTIRGSPWSEDG